MSKKLTGLQAIIPEANPAQLRLLEEYIRDIIGEDEPEPTHYGKRVPASGSVEAFQKFYRNKLRKEQRSRL